MKIVLNNRSEEIEGFSKLTVQELLDFKKFSFKFLVVKINDAVVRPDEFSSAIINDGDIVHVLHLISGG
ncbi:MAG: sulfur carrier protein ThiS [Bacteroidetes bacterium]|nr:sulfur carrier protein ThiS [Bacteroidota bacterium]